MASTLAHAPHATANDERQSAGWIGMVVFLGSWTMMFGAMFFAYSVLRARSPMWPPFGEDPLPVGMPALNTLVLLVSSVSVYLALRELRRENLARFRRLMLATLALGSAFLALQMVVWVDVWRTGLTISSGLYGSIFYTLTAFHAVHVLVGLGLLLWLAAPSLRRTPRAPGRVPVRVASMFWHFVDVVWIIMFLTVYVF